MSRKFLLPLLLLLTSALVLDGVAMAQRGGRGASGGGGSRGASSGGGSRGFSGGGARSSAGGSRGFSGGSRSSGRVSRSAPAPRSSGSIGRSAPAPSRGVPAVGRSSPVTSRSISPGRSVTPSPGVSRGSAGSYSPSNPASRTISAPSSSGTRYGDTSRLSGGSGTRGTNTSLRPVDSGASTRERYYDSRIVPRTATAPAPANTTSGARSRPSTSDALRTPTGLGTDLSDFGRSTSSSSRGTFPVPHSSRENGLSSARSAMTADRLASRDAQRSVGSDALRPSERAASSSILDRYSAAGRTTTAGARGGVDSARPIRTPDPSRSLSGARRSSGLAAERAASAAAGRSTAASRAATRAPSASRTASAERYRKASAAGDPNAARARAFGEAAAAASEVATKTAVAAASVAVGVGVSTGGWYADASLSYGYGYGYDYGYGYGSCGWYWGSYWPSFCWSWCYSGCWWGFGWGGSCYWPCRSWYSPWYRPYYGYGYGYGYGGYGYAYPYYAAAYSAPVVYQTIVYGEEAAAQQPIEQYAVNTQRDDRVARAATEYMALGDAAFMEGRYADAVRYYAKAVEWAPDDPVLYLVLSDALFATGDYHYAAYALRRALELHPQLSQLSIDKRKFYGVPADFDAQLALLEAYLQDHFLDDDARLVLAANYLHGGMAQKCVELLESPFSLELREGPAGKVILEGARAAVAAPKPAGE